MPTTLDAGDFQTKLKRLDGLLNEATELADPAAQACTRQVVQALLEMHAIGLERLLDHVGADVVERLADDDVVAGLLLLHGLHPLGVEERVQQALEQVRPYLRSHGGGVELLDIDDGVVRLRLEGSCDGCPSSAATMAQTVEQAILAKAPDITVVEVEGLAEPEPVAADGRGLVALPIL